MLLVYLLYKKQNQKRSSQEPTPSIKEKRTFVSASGYTSYTIQNDKCKLRTGRLTFGGGGLFSTRHPESITPQPKT